MRADLWRDPDELDRIVRVLRDLAGALARGAAGPGPVPPGAVAAPGSAAATTTVAARRIAREIEAVAEAAARAAAILRIADADAAACLRQVPEPGSPPPGPMAAPASGTDGPESRAVPGGYSEKPLTR